MAPNQRSPQLSFQVHPDRVQARFGKGFLSMTIPKREPQVRVRYIKVRGIQQGSAQWQGSIENN
jgi:HSP20 family molecular chaperone IbpA